MFDDAQMLLDQGRLGTSDHLFGLASECALKAILAGLGHIPNAATRPPRPFDVQVDKLWDQYNAVVSGRPGTIPAVSVSNPFSSWNVADRYEDDSAFDRVRVVRHRDGARGAMVALADAQAQGVVS